MFFFSFVFRFFILILAHLRPIDLLVDHSRTLQDLDAARASVTRNAILASIGVSLLFFLFFFRCVCVCVFFFRIRNGRNSSRRVMDGWTLMAARARAERERERRRKRKGKKRKKRKRRAIAGATEIESGRFVGSVLSDRLFFFVVCVRVCVVVVVVVVVAEFGREFSGPSIEKTVAVFRPPFRWLLLSFFFLSRLAVFCFFFSAAQGNWK